MKIQRILLVYPGQALSATQKAIYIHFPFSCLCLAAYVRDRGYEPAVLDMRTRNYREIDLSNFDVVGIGCMTGHQIRYGLEFAAHARTQNPSLPIIWGGVHPTLYPEQTCRHDLVDFVVRGEGEESLYRLLEALNGKSPLSTVDGLSWKEDGAVRHNPDRKPIAALDSLPFPAYDLVRIDDYPNVRDVFDYQTSRGCPFRCAFCYNLAFCGKRWRAKSADKVVSDILKIKERYDCRMMGFVDDELFINRKRTEAIVDGLLSAGPDIQWSASCRVDILLRYPDELLAKIHESGCKKLYFGAESGSQRILDAITKDITVEQIIAAAKKCVDNGIVPVLSFMSGFPMESAEDLKKTYEVIDRLWKLDDKVEVNGCFIYNPYPGGPLFERAVEAGIVLPQSFDQWGDWEYKYDADLPWITAERRKEMRLIFLLIRFSYYWKELGNSEAWNKRYVLRAIVLPMLGSMRLRWNKRLFAWPIEWAAWSLFMRKAIGFL